MKLKICYNGEMICYNGEILEAEIVIRSNHAKGYQIAGYIPIMRDKTLDGERTIVLKFYETREQAEDALKAWERNPRAIKDTLAKILV